MKKTIIIAGIATLLSSTLWAQNNLQHTNQQKDQNKTEMQKDDTNNKKAKKDSTRKMDKSKKHHDGSDRKMDNYNSNKQNNSGTPAEQRQLDSTINNHR